MTTDQVRAWRHALHGIPELAFAEHRTGDYLAQVLTEMGAEVVRGVGGTGLVATLRRGDGPAYGLRADMDCLPLQEVTGRPHGSRHPGAMHACGHDGHMAMVLGGLAALAREHDWAGTVHAIFQPAEEPGRGAQAMIDDGLFERFPVDAIFGLHNLPGLPVGTIHTRPGPIMASEDNFSITIHGRGGHASNPVALVDPIVIAAEIITALQSIVARSVEPGDAAVVSCTEIRTDGVRNAVPSTVTISGDTRAFSSAVQAILEERIRQISAGVCAAHGATAEVTYTREFAPTVNTPSAVDLAVAAARRTGTAVEAECLPVMASEDFGVYAAHVPACFAFIGNGTEPGAGGTPLHSSDYDLNDAILPIGARFYAELVRHGEAVPSHS